MTKKLTAAEKVTKLKKEIAKLTDRAPDSDDPRYLAQRLADLKRRKDAGEDVKHRNSAGSVVISASMPVPAANAVDEIMNKSKLGASELVRKALALWAKQNGFADQAHAIGEG